MAKTFEDCATLSETLGVMRDCFGAAADEGGGARFDGQETLGMQRILRELAMLAKRLERRAGVMPEPLVVRDLPEGVVDMVPMLTRGVLRPSASSGSGPQDEGGPPLEGGAA